MKKGAAFIDSSFFASKHFDFLNLLLIELKRLIFRGVV